MALSKEEVLQQVRSVGIVPVLRGDNADQVLQMAEAIAAGGVTSLEITMTVPNAIRVMERLVHDRPDLLVGAGTVLDPETARICTLAGAQFIVSPALNLHTIEMCKRYSVPIFPGALTPTEVVTAWQAGADAIKVFAASAMGGAKYLASLKAPLPQVELIPTGGVSHATVADFVQAGAMALGVGADLCDHKALAAGEAHRITAHASKYVDLVRSARGLVA